MATERPRITFGIIVLNGEPFTRYCLRALYPFAHQIIVVEGACPGAKRVATPEGHSIDGTLGVLKRFKAEEDPDDKVQIVTRDGFWHEKDEMSQAYAARATGEYLWQVDIDEFYKPDDIRAIMAMLIKDPTISAVSFEQFQFWGGFSSYVDSWRLRGGMNTFHRLFRWGPGYVYETHRPPTVLSPDGIDTRKIHWVSGAKTAQRGIRLYHYSFVFPKEVRNKSEYYARTFPVYLAHMEHWAERVFLSLRRPFAVDHIMSGPSWLERFVGTHPPLIEALRSDIESGRIDVEVRRTDDIERLLLSPWYRLGKIGLKLLGPVDRRLGHWGRRFVGLFADPLVVMSHVIRRISSLLGVERRKRSLPRGMAAQASNLSGNTEGRAARRHAKPVDGA